VPSTVPDAPSLSASTGGNGGEISLSWTTPNDGGDPIIRYEVYYSDGTFVANVAAPTTSFTDSGLTPSQQYSYYVVAVNGIGSSSPSNTASALAGP